MGVLAMAFKSLVGVAVLLLAIGVARLEDPRHVSPYARYAARHMRAYFFGLYEGETNLNFHCNRGYFTDDPLFGNLLTEFDPSRPVAYTPMREVSEEDMAAFTYDDFYAATDGFAMPIILRGALKRTKAGQYLTIKYLVDNFGDEVYSFDADSSKISATDNGVIQTISEFYQNITNGGSNYLVDQNLFWRHPDFYEDLELYKAVPGMPTTFGPDFNYHPIFISTFIGGYSGGDGAKLSGSAYHSAPTSNIFCLNEGRKWWKIIDTKYLPYMHMNLQPQITFAQSCDAMGKEFSWADSMFDHLPRWEGEVRAGDILFNPAWVYHHVRNMPEYGPVLAYTTRHSYYLSDLKNNFLYSFLNEFNREKAKGKDQRAPRSIPGLRMLGRLLAVETHMYRKVEKMKARFFPWTVEEAIGRGWSPENNRALLGNITDGEAPSGADTRGANPLTAQQQEWYNVGYKR